MASERGWGLLVLFLILNETQLCTLDLEIIFGLVGLARDLTTLLFLALLLVFLLLFDMPDLERVEQLDSDQVTFESTIAVLGSANENVAIEHLGGDVGVAPVALVDAEHTDDDLAVGKKGGKSTLGQVVAKQGLALNSTGSIARAHATAELVAIEASHRVEAATERWGAVVTSDGSRFAELVEHSEVSLSLGEIDELRLLLLLLGTVHAPLGAVAATMAATSPPAPAPPKPSARSFIDPPMPKELRLTRPPPAMR